MSPGSTRRNHLVSIPLGKLFVFVRGEVWQLGLTIIQESKRDRSIEQDCSRVPRAKSQGWYGPGTDHSAYD